MSKKNKGQLKLWQDKVRDPHCTQCELHKSAGHVCLMGAGPKKAQIMIVGEAPGEREDAEHTAFVGPSGRLLRDSLKKVGIDPDDCYITNAVKCRPPDNRTPSKTEVKACHEYLRQEIEKVDPDYILTVGNVGLQAFTNRTGITRHRGKWMGIVFPVFHPAYVLRSPQHEPTFQTDLERFAREVRGESSSALPTRTKVIRDRASLSILIRHLSRSPIIAFDLETNGLEEYHGEDSDNPSRIVCISFTTEPGRSFVVPLYHVKTPWRSPDKVIQLLKPTLERTDAKYVAHNGKFDCRWLAANGVFVPLTFDTMLAAHLLDENRLKGLKPLSQVLLGADDYDVGEEIRNAFNMDEKKLYTYAGKDTDYTFRLYEIFKAQLKEQPRLARIFARLMVPASNAMTRIERGGMWVDGERLAKQTLVATNAKEEARLKLLKHVPKHKRGSINFNSPPQLGEWMFGDLKLQILDLTATGNASTNESVMLRLAQQHPAPALLLEYRKYKGQLEKLTSWDERKDGRNRIHTNYKLFGTVTGRISSEKPNLQQVPREGAMRTCFGAPSGWSFVESDYSQVELRVAAMLSRDPTLLRIFATGGDPHLTTAAAISGLTEAEILASDATGKTELRKKAKPVNFGFLYGMGEQKFIDYARDNYGVDVAPGEAHAYREAYFALYDRLPSWHERQRRLARRYGQVNSPIGRIRHLPTINSSEEGMRKEAERQAINSPVQSLASDTMLTSLILLDREMPATQARTVGTVHDALLFEVRNEFVDLWVPRIRKVMEEEALVYMTKNFGVEWTVPIEVEIKVGQHWGAGVKVAA